MKTTLMGSYPKVAEDAYGTTLIGTLTRWQKKELTDAELDRVIQDLTRTVIQEQEAIGIDLVTDGQIRWEDPVTVIARGLANCEINGLQRFFDNNVYYRRPVITGPLSPARSPLAQDFAFARSVAQRPVKAVLIGPYTFSRLCEDQYYRNDTRLLADATRVVRAEAEALVKQGATWLQLDEPALVADPPKQVEPVIEAINAIVQGLKTTTALACYFGRLNGLATALRACRVDCLHIDLVSDPAALTTLKAARLPHQLGVGCVDARTTKVETVEQIHRVIREAERIAPRDRLWVSPNCGLEFLPHDRAVAKLRRLVEAVHQLA